MLRGNYITLRILEKKDSEMVRIWKNSPENYNYFANRNFISDVKQEKWISLKLEDSRGLYMIIIDNVSNLPIGMTLLEDIDYRNRNACWGIYIADLNYRKRIFALEATYLILNYAFNYLNLYKIYGNTLSSNPKGRKFHQFIGFSEEATFKNHVFVDGTYVDLIWIALFKDFWKELSCKIKKHIDNESININEREE